MDILAVYKNKDIGEFLTDIKLVFEILKNVDQEYAAAKMEFIHDFTLFKKLIKEWNAKYKKLVLEVVEDGMQIKLKIKFLADPMDVLGAAMQIMGFTKINDVPATRNIKTLQAEEYNLSFDIDNKENTLTLVPTKEGMQMIFQKDDIVQDETPEFVLCAYYGLKERVNTIDLVRYTDHFSFDTTIFATEGEGFGYERRVKLF